MTEAPIRYTFQNGHFVYSESCMGTVFVFSGRSPHNEADTQNQLEQAVEILHEADRTFSLYKEHSPLSRLARGETSVAACPPVVSEVWDACEEWEKTTDGWFSAFTPQNTFDPSGLVKTWAAQEAFDFLSAQGFTQMLMNAGGDILLDEGLTKADDWRVALHKPVSIASVEAGVLAVLDLKNTPYRAVCTSGSAERGLHIWDPKAPEKAAANSLAQVTVVGRSLVQSDVWATACFAHGPRAIQQVNAYNATHPNDSIQVVVVYPDGDLNATEGFIELFARPDSEG